LDAFGQVGLVHGHDAAVRPGHQSEVGWSRGRRGCGLRDLDRVDVADEVADEVSGVASFLL
jgi:hypothetical protein